ADWLCSRIGKQYPPTCRYPSTVERQRSRASRCCRGLARPTAPRPIVGATETGQAGVGDGPRRTRFECLAVRDALLSRSSEGCVGLSFGSVKERHPGARCDFVWSSWFCSSGNTEA